MLPLVSTSSKVMRSGVFAAVRRDRTKERRMQRLAFEHLEAVDASEGDRPVGRIVAVDDDAEARLALAVEQDGCRAHGEARQLRVGGTGREGQERGREDRVAGAGERHRENPPSSGPLLGLRLVRKRSSV
jgi:hypothetical protein